MLMSRLRALIAVEMSGLILMDCTFTCARSTAGQRLFRSRCAYMQPKELKIFHCDLDDQPNQMDEQAE